MHTILPAARDDLLVDCTTHAQQGKYGHQALGFQGGLQPGAPSTHRPNIRKVPSHLGFFRKIPLTQSSVRKGGR